MLRMPESSRHVSTFSITVTFDSYNAWSRDKDSSLSIILINFGTLFTSPSLSIHSFLCRMLFLLTTTLNSQCVPLRCDDGKSNQLPHRLQIPNLLCFIFLILSRATTYCLYFQPPTFLHFVRVSDGDQASFNIAETILVLFPPSILIHE